MKSKAAKYAEPANTVNAKSLPLQCPVTRNKVRSVQVNSVRSQDSSVSAQSSCERDKMQHIQENSVGSKTSPVLSHGAHESNKVQSNQENSIIARASSVASQTLYDRNKIQNIQENPIGSKGVTSQSTCDSSIIVGENEQLTVLTKGPKVIYPNGQNSKFEEKNVVGNVCQNARGQNEPLPSVKCDATPSHVLQKPRGVERRTYSSVRNETGNYVTLQNVTSKVSSVVSARCADHRELQNHCVEPKIADLRRGFVHQQMKNGSEIEYQNEVKNMFMGVQNSELTHQEQQSSTKIKETENLVQVDSSRQVRDGSSNTDLRPIPAKEAEQVSQIDLPSYKTNGSASIGTHLTTLTGNSLTIKSGTKEVVLVFMNPSQSVVSGRGGQITETDHCNMFQEREIPVPTKSIPAVSTVTETNTVGGRALHSDRHEVPLQSTCQSTGNEAVTNENISCEKNSAFKIRDVSADQVNDDSYHHSFQKLERPVPLTLQAHRPLLDLVPVRESFNQGFSRNFDACDTYIGSSTENPVPVRDVSAQTLPRNCCRTDMDTGNSLYQNGGLQMQLPSLVPTYREDTSLNERPLLYERPAPCQYGRDQLSSHEVPVPEAHFQTQAPFMGQHCLYGRLPSYAQHTLCNPYRDEFIDIAPEPTYHVRREPIGVLRCRRFGSSYGGQYAYHLPPRNAERAHRTSFLDMRPHIYHRTVYPEQPFYGHVDGGNMFFLNRY